MVCYNKVLLVVQLQFNDSELKYITGMLYNGFYAFELLSDRSLDNVVCGICGVVGQIYYGDGNEKNCCSTHSVSLMKRMIYLAFVLLNVYLK